jgi:hypothetical protein
MSLEIFIKNNKNQIINMIIDYLRIKTQNNQNYEVVWKEYQVQVCDVLVNYLKENGFDNIIVTTKKSTYPEFTVIHNEKKYAFDVKVSVDAQDPAYDIARLDTFIERMKKYQKEYEIIVKYSILSGVVNVYLEELHNVVGIQKKQNRIVKFRPYDGKVRPKNWLEFENNICYFTSEDELIDGIKNAQILRNKTLVETWKRVFTKDEFNFILS